MRLKMENTESFNNLNSSIDENLLSQESPEAESPQQFEETSKNMDTAPELPNTYTQPSLIPDKLDSSPVSRNDIEKENTNDYSSVFDDIDNVHQELLGSITKAKQIHDSLHKRTSILKAGIEKKQREKEILKQNIQQASGRQSNEHILSLSDELNENYVDVKEKECSQIVSYAKRIGSNVSSDFDNCLPLVDALDQEVGLLRARMKYIRILKELDTDMRLHKELVKREEEVGKRFQTLAEIFRLGISK